MGRRKAYTGSSQVRYKAPYKPSKEERTAAKLVNRERNASYATALEGLLNTFEAGINEIAKAHNKHPDAVRMQFGAKGGQLKKQRAPNPHNGWAREKAAQLNASTCFDQ